MGFISRKYIKHFVCRYDKEVGIPYYVGSDFKGLQQEPFVFTNSRGVDIHCFSYFYDGFQKDKVLLFLPGIGPGHTSYLAEIECLAKRGYLVWTLDYTGCGESKGEYLGSLNMPTLDVMEMIDNLKLPQEIIVVGHSLGAYTALNVARLREDVHKAVMLAGFLTVKSLIENKLHPHFLASRVLAYERKAVPEYYGVENLEYLKKTKDKLFFIQSEDDKMVPYSIGVGAVSSIKNQSLKTLTVQNRKHNPNYTDEAVAYMNEVFGRFERLIKDKTIKTDTDKIDYFKDVSLTKMTEQDTKMFDSIVAFIEK